MDGLKNPEETRKDGRDGPHGVAAPVAEERPAHDGVLEKVLMRRERHRGRPLFVRAGVVAAGGVVGLFAVLLSVVVPEVGLPLLLFGLRLLALEFDWAARVYARVAGLARRLAGTFGRFWSRSKVWVVLAVAALVAVAVFVLLG